MCYVCLLLLLLQEELVADVSSRLGILLLHLMVRFCAHTHCLIFGVEYGLVCAHTAA
jgi:hypothetical protein